MNCRKAAPIVLFLAIGAMVSFALFSVYRYQASGSHKTRETSQASPAATTDRCVIRGFRYSTKGGEGIRVTMAADEFRVGRKKIGFIRTALLNEVEIKNVRIQVFLSRSNQEGTENRQKAQQNAKDERLATSQSSLDEPNIQTDYLADSAKIILKEIGGAYPFPGIPRKGIASVKMAPVELRISDEISILESIVAESATLDIKKENIVFRGNVKAARGREVRQVDELRIGLNYPAVGGKVAVHPEGSRARRLTERSTH